METKTEITNWVKTNCNPEKIPTFLLEMGLKDGNLSHADIVAEINHQAKELVISFIKGDNEIQNFLSLLKSAPSTKDGRVAIGGKNFLNLSHFVLNEELKKSLLYEYEPIKKDNRRLAALIITVEENFPELWNYNPGGEKDNGWVIKGLNTVNARFREFLMLMNPKVDNIKEDPNRDSSGAYSHYYFCSTWSDSDFSPHGEKYLNPLNELQNKFEGNDYIHFYFGDGDDSMKKTLSFEVLVAYGLDLAEIIYKNLLSSISLIEKSSAIGYKQRILNQFCHEKFNEVKEKPATMAFIERILEKHDLSHILNYDMEIDTGIIAYIGGRSEYGNSGGIAMFSQIIIWLNGQEAMKEFQYRDRYSGSNDNYANDFGNVKIIAVKVNGEYFDVEVKATPRGESFSPQIVNFRIKNGKLKSNSSLNQEEQKNFLSLYSTIKEDKMSQARKFHSKQTGTCMARDYSGYVSYPDPSISSEATRPEIGVGAFVTKECIDAVVNNLQWRYTLYLVNNQTVKEICQDNAYEPSDASIFGLEIFGDELKYSTQGGRREYQL